MKRVITSLAVLGALAVPSAAAAKVQELGATADPVPASCPGNQCSAIGNVSGYQGRAGAVKNPFRIKRAGYIVAFTINLGKPNATQAAFFTNDANGPMYGSPPKVRMSVWRRGKRRKTRLDHRLMSQSRAFRVTDFFGSSPTFVLPRPLRVRKNYQVGITVPTWIPSLSGTLSKSNWWRSSRGKGSCKNVTQKAAQETTGRVKKFGCTYFQARLLYTATYVPDPRPTTKKKPTKKK